MIQWVRTCANETKVRVQYPAGQLVEACGQSEKLSLLPHNSTSNTVLLSYRSLLVVTGGWNKNVFMVPYKRGEKKKTSSTQDTVGLTWNQMTVYLQSWFHLMSVGPLGKLLNPASSLISRMGVNTPYSKERVMHAKHFAHSRLPTNAVESGGRATSFSAGASLGSSAGSELPS